MKTLLIITTLFVVGVLSYEKGFYSNYQVNRVTPRTEDQVAALRNLEKQFSFWSDVSGIGKPVHIMVAPHQRALFKDVVTNLHLENKLYIENVQQLIDDEKPATRSTTFDFNSYHKLDVIYNYLDHLAATYPHVTVITAGYSYEGREIRGIHISNGNSNSSVFLKGGIHAREWIAPATVLYLATHLISSSDTRVRAIADAHDWYVFPSFNPDGYEYTHLGDRQRLWRKTRQPYGYCIGADPNRNWGFHWMDGGASNNPCDEIYAGSSPFSEPETKSMSEFISTIAQDLTHYIAFHSFSQLLLIPYGHSSAHVENYDQLYEIGLEAAKSLRERYGTRYTVGNIVDVIYVASGGSMDWVKGTYGTPITYTYELRDTGNYGFLLPPRQILPTGEETLDSLVTIMEKSASL